MNSEQINEIAAALAKAQGQMENATRNKVMEMVGRKSYQYADLASVIDAIKKPLADNGLSYSQTTQINPDKTLWLITKLMHGSGQWISGEYPLPFLIDKPQIVGSCLTYARKYGLAAVCGIAAEDDDDAKDVAKDVAEATRQAAKQPPKFAPDIIKPPHDPQTGEVLPPDFIHTASPPQPAQPGISIQDMAREAAERGSAVWQPFYAARSKAEKTEINKIWPELEKLFDAVEGEGS